MDKMEFFMQLYGVLPRAGPGDNDSTRAAYGMITDLPDEPSVLDVGCGPGIQTIELARLSGGKVVALDLMPQMIERVNKLVREHGLSDRVETVQMDMNEMDFPEESFDLIWSEGAIYLMGFRNGLGNLRRFLKEGGYVAVSEAVWLRSDPPEKVLKLWEEYPEIDTISEKLKTVAELGYTEVGHFVIPSTSWTELYYDHLERRANELEAEWKDIPEALDVIREARFEMAVFHQHHEYYGYCFFVMRK